MTKKILLHTLSSFFLCFSLALNAGPNNKQLKLSADFNKDAAPQAVVDGAGLKMAENLNQVEGYKGKAYYFSRKSSELPRLEYKLGKALYGKEWTIALWLKIDKGIKPEGYIFRTYSTGGWGEGDVTVFFSKWGKLLFSRFDANKKQQTCCISSGAIPKGEWVHLAFTSNNGKANIFINGYKTKYKYNQDVKMPGINQKAIRIGCSSPSAKYYLNGGAIDELKIFSKALNSEEIISIISSEQGKSSELKPQLNLPFEDKVAPQSASGTIGVSSDRVIFQPGVIGQGIGMIRYGYDSKSALSLSDVPGICSSEMSASLYFIPNWDGNDNAVHGLLHARAGNFSWMLIARDSQLNFVINSGSKKNSVSLNIAKWQRKTPLHLTAAYSAREKEIYLAVNGRIAAKAKFNLKTSNANASLIIGDYANCDMYRKSQAEGVIDELRIFNSFLSVDQLKQEAERNKHVSMRRLCNSQALLTSRPASARETKLWKFEGAYTENNSTRKKIILNALWRFQLTAEGKKPLASKWHYLAVPGRYSGHEDGCSDHQFLIRNPDFSLASKSQLWEGYPTYKYSNSWFERSFKLDKSWKNKSVLLKLDELSPTSSAKVYLNGKFIIELKNAHSYEVTLSSNSLRFNGDNFLLLHLYNAGNRWSWRGIKGDVWLESSEKTAISSPQIITSVKTKKIKVLAEVGNLTAKDRKLKLEALIKGKNAPNVLSSKMLKIPAGGKVRLELSHEWLDAKLWDFENPYLYSCLLRLKDEQGRIIDEYPTFKFGFREFCIKGANYYLNGNKVHLRNNDAWMNSSSDYNSCIEQVRELKKLGYNSVRGNFSDKNVHMGNIIRVCDEEGLLLFLNIFGVSGREYTSWSNPETRKILEKKMSSRIIDWRNHPSIVMWYMSVNFLGYGRDYHPFKMADGYLPQFKMNQYKTCLEAVKIMKKYDSSRPYFFQAGGAFGPVINSNAYFCWWPQAEKNAWSSEWNKNPSKPLHIIETSFPYWRSLFGMDLRFSSIKPLFVIENAARYFGEKTYSNIEKDLKSITSKSGKAKAYYSYNMYLNLERYLKLVGKVKSRIMLETILSWRSDNISGICPFAEIRYAFKRKSSYKSRHYAYEKKNKIKDFRQPGWHSDIRKMAPFNDVDFSRPLPYMKALKKAMTPLAVFFGGNENNKTSLAANYFAGKELKHSLVMINDTLSEKVFNIDWQLTSKFGKVAASGRIEKFLKPGNILRFPIKAKTPKVNIKEEFILSAEANSPADVHIAPLTISVFPEIIISTDKKIAVYDSKGITVESLRKLKTKFDDVRKLKSLAKYSLLIVGRESFDSNFAAWAKKIGLSQWLESGKGNVIIMEQKPEALSMFGLKSNAVYSRECFMSETGLPQLSGLTKLNLCNWQGKADLAPQHKQPRGSEEYVPSPLWHWNNVDMVCAYPIHRPSAGNYKNIIVCGMDLIYSALLEFKCGYGKLLFCQLEISGRTGQEPAAAQLLNNLITHYSQANNTKKQKQLYTLESRASEFISSLAYPCRKLSGTTTGSETVVIVDRQSSKKEIKLLEEIAEQGGTVIVVSADKQLMKKFGLKSKSLNVNTFSLTKAGKERFGYMSPRDRYFRYPLKGYSVKSKRTVALSSPAFANELPVGKGRFIFVMLGFDMLKKYKQKMKKINLNSSELWAEGLLHERYNNLFTRLLSTMNVKADSPGSLLADPILGMKKINLCGKWDFRTDPDNIGLRQDWQSKKNGKWSKIKVPGYWESQGVTKANPNMSKGSKGYDGYAWYRKKVKLNSDMRGIALNFHANAIDDFDQVYVNGKEIGRTGKETEGYWQAQRNYAIPASLTAHGSLNIAIRVFDAKGNGGISGEVYISEKSAKAIRAFPYYTSPLPGYNTETSVRW